MLPQRKHFKRDNFERLLLFQVKIKKSGLFLGKLSDLLYKSQFLQILAMKKLIIFTKLRNVGGYEKISREQLESIFAGLSASKPTLKAKSKSITHLDLSWSW